MALTPDDVVTKQFQHVRFKEGFDPDEVDDFLDEIVVEWRKALAENEELKAKLAAYESGAEVAAIEAPPAAEPEVAPEPEKAEEPAAAAAPTTTTAGIIELAQRLHDEHIAEGQAQRDKLIADAEAHAKSLVEEAEERVRNELSRLEHEKVDLENNISELQEFEREYRDQLREYIEGHLRGLDNTGTSSGSSPVESSKS